jgi:hypothetical protein
MILWRYWPGPEGSRLSTTGPEGVDARSMAIAPALQPLQPRKAPPGLGHRRATLHKSGGVLGAPPVELACGVVEGRMQL